MPIKPGRVWVVAGAPGAGKTTVAQHLAAALDPPAALLDKDTLYGRFVAAMLAAARRPNGEREGAWYDTNIKIHEYGGLADTAREIRRVGCPVVLCAPYSGHIRDLALWQRLVDDLGGPEVDLVWVGCDRTVLRERILRRKLRRDEQKLRQWDDFLNAVQPDVRPPIPHHLIDNTDADRQTLITPVRRLAGSIR